MLQILDNEIAKLRALYVPSHKGNDPARYTCSSGLTLEEWYCSDLASLDHAKRRKKTQELLNCWRERWGSQWNRINAYKMRIMDQSAFSGTLTHIQYNASSLSEIKNLLFLDPKGWIYISADMKESAIPAIIEGTLRILGEMPEFANLTLGLGDMMDED